MSMSSSSSTTSSLAPAPSSPGGNPAAPGARCPCCAQGSRSGDRRAATLALAVASSLGMGLEGPAGAAAAAAAELPAWPAGRPATAPGAPHAEPVPAAAAAAGAGSGAAVVLVKSAATPGGTQRGAPSHSLALTPLPPPGRQPPEVSKGGWGFPSGQPSRLHMPLHQALDTGTSQQARHGCVNPR